MVEEPAREETYVGAGLEGIAGSGGEAHWLAVYARAVGADVQGAKENAEAGGGCVGLMS